MQLSAEEGQRANQSKYNNQNKSKVVNLNVLSNIITTQCQLKKLLIERLLNSNLLNEGGLAILEISILQS